MIDLVLSSFTLVLVVHNSSASEKFASTVRRKVIRNSNNDINKPQAKHKNDFVNTRYIDINHRMFIFSQFIKCFPSQHTNMINPCIRC